MKTTRALFIVAAALAIAMLLIANRAAHRRAEINLKLAEAREAQARLRRDLSQERRDAAGAENTAPHAVTVPTAIQTPPANAEAAFPPRKRPPGLLQFARANPQLWNQFVASKRAELGRLYLPLMQRLNLDAGQRERLKDIFAADIARGSDIGAAADAQGLSHDDPAIVALRDTAESERKRELAELLGPVGMREFDAYERALPVRGFVDGLATQLAATAPLSGPQADQLERLLAHATEPYRNGKHADPRVVDWSQVDRQLREILSPQQFAIWTLGVAHNPFGGSRRSQELERVYEQAVKRMKDAEGLGQR